MIKKIKLPEEDVGKVVQMYIDNSPVLIFGSSQIFHGDIVSQTLKNEGIDYKTIQSPGGHLIPEANGENYKVIGAGKYKKNGNIITIDGMSFDYEKSIDKRHLDSCQKEVGDSIRFEYTSLPQYFRNFYGLR